MRLAGVACSCYGLLMVVLHVHLLLLLVVQVRQVLLLEVLHGLWEGCRHIHCTT